MTEVLQKLIENIEGASARANTPAVWIGYDDHTVSLGRGETGGRAACRGVEYRAEGGPRWTIAERRTAGPIRRANGADNGIYLSIIRPRYATHTPKVMGRRSITANPASAIIAASCPRSAKVSTDLGRYR